MNNLYKNKLKSIIFLLFSFLLPMISNATTGSLSHAVAVPDSFVQICERACNSSTPVMLLLISVLYFIFLLIARYTWIILPNNQYLRVYADEVDAQLIIEQNNPAVLTKEEKVIISAIKKLLKKVLETIPEKMNWHCWVLAGTGKQLACWRNVHKAKVFAIDLFSDSDAQALAIVTSKQLTESGSDTSKGISAKIEEELNKPDLDIELIKSLTKQGQELLFNERDNYFEGLANWQNRATWLVMVSLFILVVLGLTYGSATLFILGAVGGLLSRMRKVLIRKEHAFDYGASWSTLFLAPVVGALTGWVGVLLVLVLVDAGILGDVFAKMLGSEQLGSNLWIGIQNTKEVMALTVAFGFSATFFESIVDRFEGKIQNSSTAIYADKTGKTKT